MNEMEKLRRQNVGLRRKNKQKKKKERKKSVIFTKTKYFDICSKTSEKIA